eukprot:Skav220429  [mRNA]  locus=scaffold639:788649:788924:- [translate_table: standard]
MCKANLLQQLAIGQNHTILMTSIELVGELLQSIQGDVRFPSPESHHFVPMYAHTSENHPIFFGQNIELQNAIRLFCHYLEVSMSTLSEPTA